MDLRRGGVLLLLLVLSLNAARGQEMTGYRIINITNNTSAPTQLAIDRGRLVWREADLNSGNYLLKYYTGAEIMQLDSNLFAVSAAIDGDHVVWNTAVELVYAFDTRSWVTVPIGSSYNPDFLQPVSLSGDLATFAVRKSGIGTNILVHRLSSGTDTTLSAGTWNTAPSVHHGQLAWVVSDSESANATSNIFFFDGRTTRNLSSTSGLNNRKPLVKDAQVLWAESAGPSWRARLFTGDSVITLAQRGGAAEICSGYDISDGVGIAGVRDTVSGRGRIEIFIAESTTRLTLSDSNGVWSPHIDNGLVVWQSGTGPNRTLKFYTIQTGITQNIGLGEAPVVDDSRIAWTNGDAVETYVPVTFLQLTTDGMNGWEQTKFKTIDSSHVVWGNFANSVKMRLFYGDGGSAIELADSATVNDLVMANDGYVIWRRNFDSLYYFDGSHPPVKFLDTVQAENPYVARGSIGFFGSRLTVNETIKHAWLYEISSGKLTMLSSDSGVTGNVLCEGKTACWLNGQTQRLMFYDGSVTTQLSDSLTDEHYSYRNGMIVWIEHRNGYSQVFLYNINTMSKTQLTTGASLKEYPITDGNHVVWYESFPVAPALLANRGTGKAAPLLGGGPILTFYDVGNGEVRRVANTGFSPLFWNWMSEGKIAWAANGNVYVFDGNAISQLTSDDFNINSGVYLDRGMIEWRRTPNPPAKDNGNVYRGKLHPHASFDVSNIAGKVPLAVSFTNRSWEGNQRYSWDFGDGGSSTETDPVHTYLIPGAYTVTLTVDGPIGAVTEKKVHLVRAQSSTGVAQGDANRPGRAELMQNYPNPFNPRTEIGYKVQGTGFVTLRIFDVLGREVETLVNDVKPAGNYMVTWDASRYASGVYFYTLRAGTFLETRKLILMK